MSDNPDQPLKQQIEAELIHDLRDFDSKWLAGFNMQEVKGKERKCCVMCGHCPTALADGIEALMQSYGDERAREARVEELQSIYAKATTTEHPRTYEDWHEQLLRTLQARLSELNTKEKAE